MAHALEEFDNGQVAFALRGAPAWHGLANATFDVDADISTADMLKGAMLKDWDVRLEPCVYPDGYRTKGNMNYVVRTNPADQGTDVLAVVGDRYRVFQNEDLFDFGDNILDGGASWESAGSIKDGKVVFGSLVVPREFVLDPAGANDKTTTYLLVSSSHDGSASVTASITPVRVVCQNTLNMALKGCKQSFKLRHTLKTGERTAEARRVLGLTFAHMDSFETIAQGLFQSSMDSQAWDKLVNAVYPKPDAQSAPQSLTKWQAKRDLLDDIYFQSPTQTNIKGNYWGALNALTERLDYFRSSRTANGEALIGAAAGFDPTVNAEKARI